jgi:hypothetical protein
VRSSRTVPASTTLRGDSGRDSHRLLCAAEAGRSPHRFGRPDRGEAAARGAGQGRLRRPRRLAPARIRSPAGSPAHDDLARPRGCDRGQPLQALATASPFRAAGGLVHLSRLLQGGRLDRAPGRQHPRHSLRDRRGEPCAQARVWPLEHQPRGRRSGDPRRRRHLVPESSRQGMPAPDHARKPASRPAAVSRSGRARPIVAQ